MKKNAKILLCVVALLVLAAGMVVLWLRFSPTASAGEKAITVVITHLDGSETELSLTTEAEYLWGALEPTGRFVGEDGPYGLYLTEVDGELADEAQGQYWLYTKDGEWVDYGVSEQPLTAGDHYEFFIEQY